MLKEMGFKVNPKVLEEEWQDLIYILTGSIRPLLRTEGAPGKGWSKEEFFIITQIRSNGGLYKGGSGRCDKSSISGYILKIEPMWFAMHWIWDERKRRVENDTKDFDLSHRKKIDLLFMKWGRLWEEMMVRKFDFRHVKFEMSIDIQVKRLGRQVDMSGV